MSSLSHYYIQSFSVFYLHGDGHCVGRAVSPPLRPSGTGPDRPGWAVLPLLNLLVLFLFLFLYTCLSFVLLG